MSSNPKLKMPPHSAEAERALLGACLRDNRLCLDRPLDADDFYVFAHQKVWEAFQDMYVQSGKPVNPVTLAEWLRDRNLLDDVRPGYIVELWEQAPAKSVEHLAVIIERHALRRSLIHAGRGIATHAEEDHNADACLEAAEQQIFSIAERRVKGKALPLSEVMKDTLARIEARINGGGAGIRSGWPDLDMVTGGFHDSELVILAARPSVGKTAVAINLALQVAKADIPVLFVSLEQSREELGERLLAIESGIDAHCFRTGKVRMDFPVLSAEEALARLPLLVDDRPNQTMLTIAAQARRLKLRKDVKLIIVDYLQLIAPGGDDRKLHREQQVAGISRRLKFLAKELGVPVIALSQLNRGSEERHDKRPRLADLRESGAIEQDADTVLLLHKERNDDERAVEVEQLEVIIAKQRNGPVGSVLLGFHKKAVRVVNLEPTESNR